MDRRDFLKTLAVTGAVMTVQRSEAMDILAQKLTNAGGVKVDLLPQVPRKLRFLIILVMTGRSATRTAALKKLPKLRVPRLCRLIWKATTNQSHCPKAYA